MRLGPCHPRAAHAHRHVSGVTHQRNGKIGANGKQLLFLVIPIGEAPELRTSRHDPELQAIAITQFPDCIAGLRRLTFLIRKLRHPHTHRFAAYTNTIPRAIFLIPTPIPTDYVDCRGSLRTSENKKFRFHEPFYIITNGDECLEIALWCPWPGLPNRAISVT